jgi:hypothetical protein
MLNPGIFLCTAGWSRDTAEIGGIDGRQAHGQWKSAGVAWRQFGSAHEERTEELMHHILLRGDLGMAKISEMCLSPRSELMQALKLPQRLNAQEQHP